MSIAKSVSAAVRTRQFSDLIDNGLELVSTNRQLQNGTLAFVGKIKAGRETIRPSYSVTVNGAVISNEFVARRVAKDTKIGTYRAGLMAVAEIYDKRARRHRQQHI